MAQIPLGSSRLDSSRLDTFDFVERVEPVELVVSSESSCAARLARHSQNAWARHVERAESCRVESSRAKWNLGLYSRDNVIHLFIVTANAYIGKYTRYSDGIKLNIKPLSP